MIKRTDAFIKELAEEFKLPEFIVKQAVYSPFQFLKDRMEKKEFETVMFPYIGKFGVPKNVKKYMKIHIDAKKSKRNTGGNSEQSIVQGGEESCRAGEDLQDVSI